MVCQSDRLAHASGKSADCHYDRFHLPTQSTLTDGRLSSLSTDSESPLSESSLDISPMKVDFSGFVEPPGLERPKEKRLPGLPGLSAAARAAGLKAYEPPKPPKPLPLGCVLSTEPLSGAARFPKPPEYLSQQLLNHMQHLQMENQHLQYLQMELLKQAYLEQMLSSSPDQSPQANTPDKLVQGFQEGPKFFSPQANSADKAVQGSQEGSKFFSCKWVFTGFDTEAHANFELVPRLIGRGGCNMRPISEVSMGKVRIRGRGSGHKEYQKGKKSYGEANIPLEIALSCRDHAGFVEGVRLLEKLLVEIRRHFVKFCNKEQLPVTELFERVTA